MTDITPIIHAYAVMVLVFVALVYITHRARLMEVQRRLGVLADRIDNRAGPRFGQVRLTQLTSLLLYLGERIERRPELDLAPILDFIGQEERQRGGIHDTLVNLAETMIELFPVLGIFGTVWGIAGVGSGDLGSDRLLLLFGIATRKTLWALLYLIIFRLFYAAFVQGKVMALEDFDEQFQRFLLLLERRTETAGANLSPDGNPWSERS